MRDTPIGPLLQTVFEVSNHILFSVSPSAEQHGSRTIVFFS